MKVGLVTASYDLTYSITVLNGPGDLSKQHSESQVQYASAQANRIVPTLDGRFAICTNPFLLVYDPKGNKTSSFNGHQTNVTDAVFTDNQFYTCSEDRTIKFWSKSSSRSHGCISTGASLNALALLPDKNTLAVCNEKGAVELYDVRNNERLSAYTIAQSPVRSMAITKDGTKVLAAMQNGTVHFLNIEDNKNLKHDKEFVAHKGIPLRLVISPDERYFVTTGNDSTVKLWDLQTGESAGAFETPDMTKYIWDAAFTPDSKWLCTGGTDKCARVWDVQTKELLAHFVWHKKGITALNVIQY